MTATRVGEERKLQEQVGDEGDARVHRHPQNHQQFVFFIRCTVCDSPRFTTKRKNEPNTYLLARARWTIHLAQKHPTSRCPWLQEGGAVATSMQMLETSRAADRAQIEAILRGSFGG